MEFKASVMSPFPILSHQWVGIKQKEIKKNIFKGIRTEVWDL